ncbi:hypothetical protein ACPXCG_12255 [Gordonia sp. DT218]|uniref:hypothetical protein n=1 Tax=Gordonia sp. DT218 TaxID=3416659 RepID=UPI003CEB2C97
MTELMQDAGQTGSKVVGTDPALPTMNRQGVVDFCRAMGIPAITERFVRWQTIDGLLPTYRVANRNLYSENDVRSWLESMRREGTGGDAA